MLNDWQLKTPVVFIIFNRPDTTERVFAEIRRAKPPKLLVIADGPRQNRLEEAKQCAAARAVVDRIDWPCDVMKNYSDTNLGCKRRVSSGLDWAFNAVEEAIVLEDDCLPHPTFFRFCEELLQKYRLDERIMMISGDNFQFGHNKNTYSYYYSIYTHIWGWASWRRAWKHYDVNMSLWPEIKDKPKLNELFKSNKPIRYWTKIFEKVYKGEIDTWDYQLCFACWTNNGMTILPSINLVSNIGFGNSPTHTSGKSMFANIKREPIKFPLSHPLNIEQNIIADAFTENNMFSGRSFLSKAADRLRGLFS